MSKTEHDADGFVKEKNCSNYWRLCLKGSFDEK